MRTRSIIRKASREAARKVALYNGPQPREEPARDDSCHVHHRQRPCKRCLNIA